MVSHEVRDVYLQLKVVVKENRAVIFWLCALGAVFSWLAFGSHTYVPSEQYKMEQARHARCEKLCLPNYVFIDTEKKCICDLRFHVHEWGEK